MLNFLDLLTNETISLETYEINTIIYTPAGIEITDLNGNKYLTKIIEPA